MYKIWKKLVSECVCLTLWNGERVLWQPEVPPLCVYVCALTEWEQLSLIMGLIFLFHCPLLLLCYIAQRERQSAAALYSIFQLNLRYLSCSFSSFVANWCTSICPLLFYISLFSLPPLSYIILLCPCPFVIFTYVITGCCEFRWLHLAA